MFHKIFSSSFKPGHRQHSHSAIRTAYLSFGCSTLLEYYGGLGGGGGGGGGVRGGGCFGFGFVLALFCFLFCFVVVVVVVGFLCVFFSFEPFEVGSARSVVTVKTNGVAHPVRATASCWFHFWNLIMQVLASLL